MTGNTGPLTEAESDSSPRPACQRTASIRSLKARARRRLREVADRTAGQAGIVNFMLIPNDSLDGLTPAEWLAVGRDRDAVDQLVNELDRDA